MLGIVVGAALAGCRAVPGIGWGGRTLREACEQAPALGEWRADAPREASPFDDNGRFFRDRDPAFAPPEGWRISAPAGEDGFLTLELYSRSRKDPTELARVVEDPDRPGHRVWRLAAPEHTDGILLRSSRPLGRRYRICARLGRLDVGSGEAPNGYDDAERAGPWLDNTATDENGAYFGAIYRSVPIPQNNAVAHHERLVFIDSDNNTEGWTKQWDPAARAFAGNGRHPIVLGAVPAKGDDRGINGKPFLAYAEGRWHPPGRLYAVDAYRDRRWYTACLERDGDRIVLSLEGDFRIHGPVRYRAAIDLTTLDHRDAPHYWLLGDPHTNYYEGSLLVDDVTLTTRD
jgi:hypothetical protein